MGVGDAIKGAVDFVTLKASIAAIVSEARKLRRGIDDAIRLREEEANAPLPREDVEGFIIRRFEGVGATWLESVRRNVEGMQADPERAIARAHQEITSSHTVTALNWSGDGSANDLMPNAMIFLMRDALVEGVKRALDQVDWPEDVGLPWDKRQARLAELDEQIVSLEGKYAALRQQAAAVGVHIDQVDSVTADEATTVRKEAGKARRRTEGSA